MGFAFDHKVFAGSSTLGRGERWALWKAGNAAPHRHFVGRSTRVLDFLAKLLLYFRGILRDHQEVTVNKTELIGKISEVSELSRREAEKALDSTLYAISSAVKGGDAVRITGFGTFKLRPRAARTGRNPQTGTAVRIKASNGIAFAAGATLKSQLNSRGAIPKPSGLAAAPAKAAAPAAKAPAKKAPAAKAPAKKAPAAKAPVKRAPAKKAPAKAPAKKAPAKAPAKKAPAAKAPVKRAPAKKAPARKAAKR
ncbi:MAG: HU family DNA-binding protein [Acidimicrobiales bacterium]